MTDTQEIPTLLLCPFCGMPVELRQRHEDALLVVACPENSPCHGSGLGIYMLPANRAEAVAAWNRRAAEAQVVRLTAALSDEREACAKVADKHRARIVDHDPDVQGPDLVAYGYGNAALNIAAAIGSRSTGVA